MKKLLIIVILIMTFYSVFAHYPNPVKSNSEIVIESEELIESISISDMSGKNSINYMQIGQYSYKLPISGIAKGVYFLTVNNKTQKFVVE